MKKIVLLFLLVISMQLVGKEINGNYSNFLYYEDAVKSGSEVRITPDEGGKVGAVWSRNIFDLNENFHFEYEIYLGTKGIQKKPTNLNIESQYIDDDGNIDIGADGMAFAFKSSDYKDVNYGKEGQYIGYGNHGTTKTFEKSFGVKFDTYTNPYYDPQSTEVSDGKWHMGDIKKDHIAFIAGGKIATMRVSGIIGGDSQPLEIDEMEDGEWHKVTFDWNASSKTFKYTFRDGIKTYTNTYSGDIVQEYLGGRYAYFGFTSSTGQWMNEQKIRNPIIKGVIPTKDYKLDIKKEVVSGNNYILEDTVKYKITITNTGGETLTNIKLKDGIDISDNAKTFDVELENNAWTELGAGKSIVTYGTKKNPDPDKKGSITQGDIDKGSIVRTAAVEAEKNDGEKLHAAAEATVYANIVNEIKVTKEITSITDGEDHTKIKQNYTKAGDIIVYKFTLTNKGTQTLKDLSVSDLKIPGIVLTSLELNPETTATGTGEYIVKQEDVDRGSVINTANFRAVKPDGSVIGKSATATANAIKLVITKKVTDTDLGGKDTAAYGEELTYVIEVTNNSNIDVIGAQVL
ncbi:MAG: L-type lectin-domain containing protein, partial [Psychrilyobacter sp.]|uniref:L-type lectin-domain containing protein n=1 Tax=Psychrilyobacter sp. TaxID=2586924 RepID=UPI003C78D809